MSLSEPVFDHEDYDRTPDGLVCRSCRLSWPCDGLRAKRAAESASIDDHEPGPRDAEDHLRCAGCGYRWPCPDVRRAGRTLTPNEDALLELLEPGWSVWARSEDPDRYPTGGVVLGADGDVFVLLDWRGGAPAIRRLRLAELEPSSAKMPNAVTLRSNYRRICSYLGTRKGAADTDEVRLVETALTLARLT